MERQAIASRDDQNDEQDMGTDDGMIKDNDKHEESNDVHGERSNNEW